MPTNHSVVIQSNQRRIGTKDRLVAADDCAVSKQLLLRAYVKAKLSAPERGATAVEYGLIVALIAAIIIGLLQAIGASTGFGFGSFNSEYETYKP